MADSRPTKVRPRDAASVVVVRHDADGEPSVLMGRRSLDSRFMPGVYVFPGGAVEAGDGKVRPATSLDATATSYLKVGNSPARARRLAIAAVRETYEETGLMIAGQGDVGPAHAPAWAAWAALGLAPKLGALQYVARAITPPYNPIRFHARFFMADATDARGELKSDGELEDITWVPLSETDALPLADIQRFLVRHLKRLLGDDDPPPGKPMFCYRRGRRAINYD